MGILLNFKKLTHYNTFILNPEWLTKAVYNIISTDIIKKTKGILSLNDLKTILPQKEKELYYPEDKNRFILEIMQEFELAYYSRSQEKYFIPAAFNEDEPENIEFEIKESLHFRISFAFLPPTIMPRFIVKSSK